MIITPTGRAGVYVHFPWCLRHCPYCDFAVTVSRTIPHAAYADAILAEWDARLPELQGTRPSTLYIGGGTPGLWEPTQLARVIAAVQAASDGLDEVTVEANPEEFDAARARALADAGVTRISLGAQSTQASALATLGRAHDASLIERAANAARDAGIPHLSIDLIIGVPGTSPADVAADIAWVGALPGVDHLSVYELTWEPGTGFARRQAAGLLQPWEDGTLARVSSEVVSWIAAEGFERYEISNYARPGGRAVHNSAYWRGDAYLGLGVGAHSLQIAPDGDAAIRRANTRATRTYLTHGWRRDEVVETLPPATHLREVLMTGLRTSDGPALTDLARRFGFALEPWLAPALHRWQQQGWVTRDGDGGCRPTLAGMQQADSMAEDLFDLDDPVDGGMGA